jgi:hypothetical protein
LSLIQLLIKKKIIDKERAIALEYEVKKSNQREETVILDKKIVPEDFLFNLKSQELKVPFITVSADDVPLKILETVPEESAKYYGMIPFGRGDDGQLQMGMIYPEDIKAKEGKVSPKSLDAPSFLIQLTTPFALQGWCVGVLKTAFQV